jgi:hypothetical protein
MPVGGLSVTVIAGELPSLAVTVTNTSGGVGSPELYSKSTALGDADSTAGVPAEATAEIATRHKQSFRAVDPRVFI